MSCPVMIYELIPPLYLFPDRASDDKKLQPNGIIKKYKRDPNTITYEKFFIIETLLIIRSIGLIIMAIDAVIIDRNLAKLAILHQEELSLEKISTSKSKKTSDA
jgi:hypothetical protein